MNYSDKKGLLLELGCSSVALNTDGGKPLLMCIQQDLPRSTLIHTKNFAKTPLELTFGLILKGKMLNMEL